jgi:hypothetical protein
MSRTGWWITGIVVVIVAIVAFYNMESESPNYSPGTSLEDTRDRINNAAEDAGDRVNDAAENVGEELD